MSLPEAESTLSILYAYSYIAAKYGKVPEAINGLMKAVAVDQKNKKVRGLLAELLCNPDAVQEVKNILPSSTPQSAQLYAFLSTICKDFSSLQASIALQKIACTALPASANHVLNLIHLHELTGDYRLIYGALLDYCAANKAISVGSGPHSMTCGGLLQLLEVLQIRSAGDAIYVNDVDLLCKVQMRWVEDASALSYAVVVSGSPVDADVQESCPYEGVKSVQYADNDLDLLAILFTVTKLLYLHGRIDKLPMLIRTVESLRVQTKKPLHETLIRNEAAYYATIVQIVCTKWASLASPESLSAINAHLAHCARSTTARVEPEGELLEPVYVLGDSHTLSPAWTIITVKGARRLLVPKLVTGIKQWHLRPESKFYPKANFQQVVSTIPNGSQVMVIIGEIDCREGMLYAVEKDYYDTLQEAMEYTISLFVTVLRNLMKTKQFKLLIHPIPCVLNETRSIITNYSLLYRIAVAKINGAAWLDFYEQYVDSANMLKDRFKLDGTHLNPCYVELVEGAMNTIA